MVAGREAGNARADRLDNASTLVTEHDRRRPPPLATENMEVGAAETDPGDAHEDVAGAGLVELDLGNVQRAAGLAKERGARPHGYFAAAFFFAARSRTATNSLVDARSAIICSAKLSAAFCHSSSIVEVPSLTTIAR